MVQITIQMVILFSIVAVGYVAKRAHVMDSDLDRKLSKLILSTALPAMALGSVLGAMTAPAALLVVGSSLAEMPARELVGARVCGSARSCGSSGRRSQCGRSSACSCPT